jgi:TRAP transporter 4TM/12TM fusion protein
MAETSADVLKTEAPKAAVPQTEVTRYRSLPKPLKVICVVLWATGIGFFVWYMMGWTIGGWVLKDVQYYYVLYITFGTCIFLCLPMRKKDRGRRIPWYDIALSALLFSICLYYILNAYSIAHEPWIPPPSTLALVFPIITILLALEGGRRMAGLPFMCIVMLVGTFPLYAEHMPGILYGVGHDFIHIVAEFGYGKLGMLGLPAQTTGTILIGFLMFAGVLIASGAGGFFLNLALVIMGRFRGGPAKVAVLASGFFGSLSGSTISNIVATGSVTIPAMKQMGYPPHYAGAIEAVASSGGVIMPPVMGAIAFLLTILTEIPYSVIMVAAFVPALLYYWGLLVQVDSYAARVGLKGLPREEIPSLWKTLKTGWVFIFVIFFLVFALLYMRWEARSPIYATALMIVLSFTNRKTWMTPSRFIATLVTIGSLVTYVMAVLFSAALLLIGIQISGTLTALVAQIVMIGSDSIVLVLVIAALVCYLLGMVGMAIIPYIVMAVTAIPAIATATGIPVLAVHFFVIFYLMSGPLTPPVCYAAFTAAALAGARPMKTGFTAMRLAIVLYFIPWFFVFRPALILDGPVLETAYLFFMCILGIWILGSGLEGYLLRVGRLETWARPLLILSGFLIAFPGWMITIIGAGIATVVITSILITKKMSKAKLTTISI